MPETWEKLAELAESENTSLGRVVAALCREHCSDQRSGPCIAKKPEVKKHSVYSPGWVSL